MNTSNQRHKSTRQEKVDWLLAHQDLWVGWQYRGDTRSWTIVAAMKDAGLVSMSTYAPDVALDTLITEARVQRRDDGSSES